MSTPSSAALRATRALQQENGRRLLARAEFLTQEEIAAIIDRETRAPELRAALREVCTHAETAWRVNGDDPPCPWTEKARALLARLT